MYANAGPNDIVIRDEAYASQLFHQAAELGYKFSQFQLATAYEYGLMGCPVDPRQSIFWYTHAAAQGEHQSELALSGWYLTGAEGILQQSDTEAYLWARKAATSCLAKAEYAMGYYTEVGIGVTANMEDAKRWYWRAAGECFTVWHFDTIANQRYSTKQPKDFRKPANALKKSRRAEPGCRKLGFLGLVPTNRSRTKATASLCDVGTGNYRFNVSCTSIFFSIINPFALPLFFFRPGWKYYYAHG